MRLGDFENMKPCYRLDILTSYAKLVRPQVLKHLLVKMSQMINKITQGTRDPNKTNAKGPKIQ